MSRTVERLIRFGGNRSQRPLADALGSVSAIKSAAVFRATTVRDWFSPKRLSTRAVELSSGQHSPLFPPARRWRVTDEMLMDEPFAWLRDLTGNFKRLADAELVGVAGRGAALWPARDQSSALRVAQ